MKVLVANLGSTSFKCKLFDISNAGAAGGERVLASGTADRIGQGDSAWSVTAGQQSHDGRTDLADHAAAIELLLGQFVELGAIETMQDVEAIGFKAVHGGPISGAVRVDDEVLATMAQFNSLAPAHNPPYIAAMKSFRKQLPNVEQVAAFETGFHSTIPKFRQLYGVPYEWYEKHGIRRYGFHGASNGYIAWRMAQLAPEAQRIITLHLGGSCSIGAIDGGDSVAHTMGATPQTGVFHSSRVGDFDPFAMHKLMDDGLDLDAIFDGLGKTGGLLGISGVSPDLREIEQAAKAGNERAELAIEAFVDTCRQYVGAYLAVLGGANAIVFTGGIGQFGKDIREAICADMDYAGVELNRWANRDATGKSDQRIDDEHSRVQIWIVPANEELIVARLTVQVLQEQKV